MATGDTYYFKWRFSNSITGKTYAPGIHVRQDGVSFDFNSGASYLKAFWDGTGDFNDLSSIYTDAWSLDAVVARRIDPIEPLEQEYTTGLPVAGSDVSTESYDPQVAVVFSWRTGNIGRSYRGRTYFIPPDEGNWDDGGVITSGTADFFVENCNTLITKLSAAGLLLTPVVWSPLLATAFDITNVLVDKRARSQRRRQNRLPDYAS